MLTVTACLIGLAATIACLRAWRKLGGTTLAAPCAWAAASLALVTCAAGASAAGPRADWTAHLDYLAGITTLAPFVALLGAKRPQDRAWQLIVAALVALFAFQDFRSWAIDPSASPTPQGAWQGLTAGLLVMQLLNYVATRHGVAGCLALAGQVCVFGNNLAEVPMDPGVLMPCGLILVSAAVFAAAARERARRSSTRESSGAAGQEVCCAGDATQGAWLEFRDRYGAFWALRVAERVNAVAAQQRSPFRLRWSGFRAEQIDSNSPEVVQLSLDDDPILNTFEAILARFLSSSK